MRYSLGVLLVLTVACSRGVLPDEEADGGADLTQAADLADAPRQDLTEPPDLLPAAKDEVLWVGSFTSRGKVSLVRRGSGDMELEFSSDFYVDLTQCPTPPPDPTKMVLMTYHPTAGMFYDSRYHIRAGTLKAARGAQVYPLKGIEMPDWAGRWYVHIFCALMPAQLAFTIATATMGPP